MPYLTANGFPVLSATIQEPASNAWIAELEVDAEDASKFAVGATVTIQVVDTQIQWVGTVATGGAFVQRVTARVVGGAGGFSRVLPPAHYVGVPLAIPLAHILLGAGEILATSLTAAQLATQTAVLATLLSRWSRIEGTAGSQLMRLLEAVPDASYRVLRDGTIFVGIEPFSEQTIDRVDVIDEAPIERWQEIATDLPELRPAVTFQGRRTGDVVHRVEPTSVRTEVYYLS